jgi:hypothetical protein
MGNTSQLFLSTTQVNIGGGSSLGRLVARGDGTNPIARFENNSGTNILTISQAAFGGSLNFDAIIFVTNTNTLSVTSPLTNTANVVGTLPVYSFTQGNDNSTTASTSNFFRLTKTINPSAGSTNFRNFIVEYTINASGAQTGTATGIFLNATETALNGMGHNLMDLGTGGTSFVSRFTIANTGFIRNAGNDISKIMLQLGGTTSVFPAIKRNGTTIDFRLADDSGSASISANIISGSILTVTQSWALTYRSNNGDIWATLSGTGATTKVSSKVLWNFDGLPTTRPATVGDLYVDTAANILANGDRIVAIRV